jgi:SSS family solute:Na+ symporter
MMVLAQAPESGEISLRLDLSAVDILILLIYFVWVIGIGFALKRAVTSSLDFFLSGRSLPAWICGLAFISANLGAIEILGQSASGAQYGLSVVHYYWIGALPAMVFLGIVMMPFYYGSKVRSVPEYLRLRYNSKAHLINATTFVLASLLVAGVNLFALATVIEALLGIPLPIAVVLSAGFVLSYILLGGLSSAIYNEVMQFFVILAGLVPLVYVSLRSLGGWDAFIGRIREEQPASYLSAWEGTGFGGNSPLGDWFGIVMGLGFCLSFGYWTTNFAEVQRAMSAKDDNAARMTPIIGAFPKFFIPLLVVVPGMAATLILPGIGEEGGDLQYNDAIPALMAQFLPEGVLGVAVTGLVAAFMAGMAANVSSFNAVFTYDIWQDYIRPGRPDRYYLVVGRWVTVIGVGIGILTAFIASGFSNISNYLQVLFSFFNVPLFCAFIIGMFWKRASVNSGFWGILVGTITAVTVYAGYKWGYFTFRSDIHESFWGSIFAFLAGAIAMAVVSMRESRPSDEKLHGLVYGMEIRDMEEGKQPFYRNPVIMGMVILIMSLLGYLYVATL